MNLVARPATPRANSHFVPAGKPAPPRPRTSAALTASSSASGGTASSARRSPDQSPGRVSTGSSSTLASTRLGRGRRGAGEQPLDRAGAGVDHVAVAHGRARVAVAEADGLGRARPTGPRARSPSARPSASRDRRRRARRRSPRSTPCRCTRARGAPARREQVVVERRDAVDRRLGQARALRGDPPVVVGDLSASIHRLFEHVERGGRSLLVVAADQLHQIPRHARHIVASAAAIVQVTGSER